MNILNNITIKNLKLNKKRTIVTIIGILLSTALICAVAGMVSSFQATLISEAIIDNGNQHVTVLDVEKNDLKYFVNNTHVKSMYITENIGYANILESQNPNKPYIFLKGYTKEAFTNTTINITSGRLPQNANEIIISKSLINDGEVNLHVGDYLKLDIGYRTCSDGSLLNQQNPYYIYEDEVDECQEKLNYKYTKEYKIVGIMERPNYNEEPFDAPGYTAITYSDNLNSDYLNVSLLFKDASYYKTFTDSINYDNYLKKYSYSLNNDLLRWSGVSLSDRTMNMLYLVASVVIGIIILTSVFVIKNSFDISINEKTKQYGMLSSIGATSKQIKKNVLYEGFILGAIGIPLGILCGILADFILVQIINILIGSFLNDLKFVFKVPIFPIVLSALLGIITIYLSVIKSARRSSKISPIEAIRNNNEIKISNKKLKVPKIINKLFGIGGEIAYKNLKRSKKKYRTTVISIVVSVFVFISLSSFISYGFKITNQYYLDLSYDIRIYLTANRDNPKKVNSIMKDLSKLNYVDKFSIPKSTVLHIDNLNYYSKDYQKYYPNQDTSDTHITIISLNKEEYERYINTLGVNINSYKNKGILYDYEIFYNNEDKKYHHFNTYNLNNFDSMSGTLSNGEEYSIPIAKRVDKLPMGLEGTFTDGGYLIVNSEDFPNLEGYQFEMYFASSDADKLEKEIKNYFQTELGTNDYNLYNVSAEAKAQNSMIILVSIFLYGFIIVISLIGITNIFNTISTNMNLRKKEFAMLKSIGMTKKEFNKMIRLESVFYGSKALIIGIPLGIIGSFLIYKAFASGNDMNYSLPLTAIIISIIVVFLLISLIMYVSINKINKQNIIETIRNDNI